jgi:hypothetical protein
MRFLVVALALCFSSVSGAVSGALPEPIPSSELLDKIEFHYQTTEGDFELECKHWIGNLSSGDFSIVCGKGTKQMRRYSAHLVIRTVPKGSVTSFEILYWVTDRNAKTPVPAFSSHSQIFTVDGNSRIRQFQMSQGLENDYAQMILRYKP